MDSLPARNALARNASHTDASGSPAIAGGPNDPSDPNNGNNNNPPASPTGGPQPFGSGFNPHVNPVDPNNPYATQPPNPPARNASHSDAGGPNLPNIPNQDLLPKLYSGLQWDLTQRKILLFTSGKRRIEQEGVYMESAQIPDLPQEFINYYTAQLTNSGFKETLNSSDPNGTTITYAKDDLFLTFGVKNIYSGSGDNKKLIGYKAFIEHN